MTEAPIPSQEGHYVYVYRGMRDRVRCVGYGKGGESARPTPSG